MKLDPRKIPDELVDRAACAMQGANALYNGRHSPWSEVKGPERVYWLCLARAGLVAISIHADIWPALKR